MVTKFNSNELLPLRLDCVHDIQSTPLARTPMHDATIISCFWLHCVLRDHNRYGIGPTASPDNDCAPNYVCCTTDLDVKTTERWKPPVAFLIILIVICTLTKGI